MIKHIGDGVLANFEGPVRALRCGQEMVKCLKSIGLTIRAGIQVGEVVLRGADATGIAINIAARVMDHSSKTPSRAKSAIFRSSPPAYPVSPPLAPTTR